MKLHPRFTPAHQTRKATKKNVRPEPQAVRTSAAFDALPFGRLWNPAVVDRLRAPLTRFRD